MENYLKKIYADARKHQRKILFPEAFDPRILKAIKIILKEKIAQPVVFGGPTLIKKLKQSKIPYHNVKLAGSKLRIIYPKAKGVAVINPKSINKKEYAEWYMKARKGKCPSIKKAIKLMDDPNYLGCMMVKHGEVNGMVSGSASPTSHVLRPALKLLREKNATVSSFFFMQKKKKNFFFADCAVNIMPDEKQLAEIAVETAKSAKKLFKIDPRIAFLSFSTHGSGQSALSDKMKKAAKIAKKKNPKLNIDGELQVDAALFPEICKFKSKQCKLKKPANILIFPDLQCGNISYKLVEWLGHYKAIGPIVQGLSKPVNDLSRGCTVDDIVNVTAITASEIIHKC